MIDRLGVFTSRKFVALIAIVFVLLLALLATLIDWRAVLIQIASANRPMLAASLLSLALGYLAYAGRWMVLLGTRLRLISVFHTSNAGQIVNALLPGRPGDPVRIVLFAGRTGMPIFAVTSSIVVERWYEQIMRLAALGGAFMFGAGAQTSLLTALGSVVFLVGSFLLMLLMLRRRDWLMEKIPPWLARLPHLKEPQARKWLGDLLAGLASVASLHSLLKALMWSTVSWAFFWGFHFLCLLALHPTLELNDLLAISLGSLALTPPSVSSLPGVYQMVMVAPLAMVGYDRDLLTSYSLVMNTLEMTVILLLGIWGTFATGLTLRELFDKAKSAEVDEAQALLE